MPVKSKGKTKEFDPFAALSTVVISPSKYWDVKPVGMEEFLISKKYLNLEKRVKKKGVLWEHSLEVLLDLDKQRIRQAMLIYGMGSGKSFISSCLQCRGVYQALCLNDPQQYYGLAPDERIFFLNMAINRDQAENVVFSSIMARLVNSPWFQQVGYKPLKLEIIFPKNLYVICGNSKAYAWHGYHILRGVLDEACKFVDEKDKPVGEKIWNALESSGRTRFPDHYKITGISSPLWEDDFGMRKYKELKMLVNGGAKDVYADSAATWECNPKQTFEDFKEDFKRNPEAAWRDYGARPPTADNPYFGDPDVINRNVTRSMINPVLPNGEFRPDFKPEYSTDYFIHVDLGLKHDRCGIAMVHVSGELEMGDDTSPVVTVDLMEAWEAPPKGEIRFSDVRKRIKMLRDKFDFGIFKVTFDRWQSVDSKQQLEEEGFDVDIISIDRDSSYHDTLKEMILEKRIKYSHHPIFITEARRLRLIKGSKVDHMPGGSKDLWDAVAGAVGTAILETDMGSSIQLLE